ncbi:hypothetical protein [Maribacter sp. 2210JD10-5]|uniref:hypothetical protein n=1 Tax=Maribacter sp. 2210JD10-5 TaxID=3386272 RepID=UPI0039BD13B2
MRNLVLSFFTLLFLVSCSIDDGMESKTVELQFTSQTWKLIRMTGSFVGSVTEGDAMDWQETYVFNPDGTFLKSRTRQGMIIEASGTFEVVEFANDDQDYLELVFLKGTELAGNCYGNNSETLVYRSPKELSSTWQACDGPGLDYVLVEE